MEKPPMVVDLQLTFACNLRCRMCGQRGNKLAVDGAELSSGQWLDILGQVAVMGAKVSLWGGEPLASPHIDAALAEIGRLGLPASMVTNGTLLAKRAGSVANSGLGLLYLSIDGPPAIHDRVRGVPGTFAHIAEGLSALRQACAAAGRTPPRTVALSVMQRDNQDALAETVEAVRALGVDRLVFAPLMFIGDRVHLRQARFMEEKLDCQWLCSPGWDTQGLFADPGRVSEALAALPGKKGGMEVATSLPQGVDLAAWQSQDTQLPPRKACLVPWRKLNVMPDGQCCFCGDFPDYKLGDAKRSSLAEIWNGPRARRFREVMREHGPFPACRRCLWLHNDFIPSELERERY